MKTTPPPGSPCVHTSLAELVAMQWLRGTPGLTGRQPPSSLLAGRHASRLRGRGLIFEDLREYRPGDDIRRIDWRATARTGRTHTRVYAEERERPVLLVVDQRLGMFFGSEAQMKSVTAAETAAAIAWQVLAGGDRIGATVFGDRLISDIRPQRSRKAVMQVLKALAESNAALGVDRDIEPAPQQLDRVLAQVAARATHDWLIVLISDFQGIGPQTREHVARLARHNDVVAVLVWDRSALAIPAIPHAILGDGRRQADFDLARPATRNALHGLLDRRSRFLERLRSELAVPCLSIDTGGDVAGQLARALGQAA
ncbi:DUF58 domain-containing protein [uncultured Dechloromonas sp.]|uniref:DUF58 domain-containing protein n=1 Tax=uncultured Dechloromonas sp. TaxID=171719 RepID=UPI0025DD64AC|nr:DUF58 domain-containing protein [uncultured Dechloromonas sp.]